MTFIAISTATLSQLKAISQRYGIEVWGDRRKIEMYRKALYGYLLQANRLAIAAANANCTKAAEAVSAIATALHQEALDSAIAASMWTYDAGMQFRAWSEAPANKDRANQLAASVAAIGSQAFDAWCFSVSTTIEAGYRSRPYVEEAFARLQEHVAAASVLMQFMVAVGDWLQRFDWEEVEEYQIALLAASQPVALLAPVRESQAMADDPWNTTLEHAAVVVPSAPLTTSAVVPGAPTQLLLAPSPQPAPRAASASQSKSKKAGSSNRKKGVGERKSRA